MYFCYFVNICASKRAEPFIWTNLIPLHKRMLSCRTVALLKNCCWQTSPVCQQKYFRRATVLQLKDALCQVWLKLTQWLWRRYLFIFCKCLFCYYLSPHRRSLCTNFGWYWTSGSEVNFSFVIIAPWKRAGSFIWTKSNPLHQRMLLCQVWLKLA